MRVGKVLRFIFGKVKDEIAEFYRFYRFTVPCECKKAVKNIG